MYFARLLGRDNKITPEHPMQQRPSIALEPIQCSAVHIDIKTPASLQKTSLSPSYDVWKNHIFPFFTAGDGVILSFTSIENYAFIEKTIGKANLKLLIDSYRVERLNNTLNNIAIWVRGELAQYNNKAKKKSNLARAGIFISGISASAATVYYGVKKMLTASAEFKEANDNSHKALEKFKESCKPSELPVPFFQTPAYACLETCSNYSWEEKNPSYYPNSDSCYGKDAQWIDDCKPTLTHTCAKYNWGFCSDVEYDPNNCNRQCRNLPLTPNLETWDPAYHPIIGSRWIIASGAIACAFFLCYYRSNFKRMGAWFSTNEEKIYSENLKNSSLFHSQPKDSFTYKALNTLATKDAEITIIRACTKIRKAKEKIEKCTNIILAVPLLTFFVSRTVNHPEIPCPDNIKKMRPRY